MSADENKALVRQLHDTVQAGRPTQNWDVLDAVLAPDFVYHDPTGTTISGLEAYRQLLSMYSGAFDYWVEIEDLVAEDDKVVALVTAAGTHIGDLMGIASTGKTVSLSSLLLYRLRDG